MIMQKWFEIHLDTEEGRQQIRREVAERVGWRVDRHELSSGEPYWVVTRPDGTTVEHQSNGWVFAAWGIEEDAWMEVPEYPHDLNAAAVLQHPYSTVTVKRWNDGRIVVTVDSFEPGKLSFTKQIELTHSDAWTEATVRCLAWLELDDIRKSPDPRRMSGQY